MKINRMRKELNILSIQLSIHSFYKMTYDLIRNFELDRTSPSDIQYAWLIQAAVICGTFSGL